MYLYIYVPHMYILMMSIYIQICVNKIINDNYMIVNMQVLGKEVGEGVNVSSLLGTNSGWRGRAQQIIMLQNKVLYMHVFTSCSELM